MGDANNTTNNIMQLIQSTKMNKDLTVMHSRLQLRRQKTNYICEAFTE
jgi:hypothetical protein